MFNQLAYPYFTHRQEQKNSLSNKKPIGNVLRSGKYLEYHEQGTENKAAGPEFNLFIDSKLN